MPLTRYQIRNEYSLADPELYKAADRDDPEALLEGVDMAGLIGVLRQLGDLAEFAAEIFHDLHEEVMATAARGHGLMVRVQQIEAEFPSIEKALLLQTNHSSFYSNAGVDWHPNLQMKQNLITRGDLPRCVMDSYEECRGPPRLFLLDKFDVAGAGACLKRYTDPSLFKVEAAPCTIPSVDVQREKRIRKAKKKGSRWRNGETPEITTASHAKLHELFLVENIEKSRDNPARLVKLKKRQLNASPFDPRSGKSYMEKFLESPMERNAVREISVTPLALKMTSDNSSESGPEIHDISTVSPVNKSSQGKDGLCASPNARELVLKSSINESYGEVIDRQSMGMPETPTDGVTDEKPSIMHKVTIEKEIVVDGQGQIDCCLERDRSDDMISEVDNYMDALATMESEMETDNEYRSRTGHGFSSVLINGADSDRNEENMELQANSWDSHSIGNYSSSDDGNSSLKKEKSSFSYSDTRSNLAENAQSDGEEAVHVAHSEACTSEILEMYSNHPPVNVQIPRANSQDLVLSINRCMDENNIHDPEVLKPSDYCSTDSSLQQSDSAASAEQQRIDETLLHQFDETQSVCTKPGSELSNVNESAANLVDSSAVYALALEGTKDDSLSAVCAASYPLDKLDGVLPDVFSDALLHDSNNSEMVPAKQSSDHSVGEELHTDSADEKCAQNMVNYQTSDISSPLSTATPREEQSHLSALPESEVHVDVTSLADCSDVVSCDNLVFQSDYSSRLTRSGPENLMSMVDTSDTHNFKEEQLTENLPHARPDSPEQAVLCSKNQANLEDTRGSIGSVEHDSKEESLEYSAEDANFEDASRTGDAENISLSTSKVDEVEADAIPHELPSSSPARSTLESNVDVDDVVAGSVQSTEIAVVSNGVLANTVDEDCKDVVCQPLASESSDLMKIPEFANAADDQHREEVEVEEPFLSEHVGESEVEKKKDDPEVVPSVLPFTGYKLVLNKDSNSEMVDCTQDPALVHTTESNLNARDISTEPAHSELSRQLNCPHPEDGGDTMFSPTAHPPVPETSSDQLLESQFDQSGLQDLEAEKAKSKSPDDPYHIDQESRSHDASEFSGNLPTQPSASESLPQLTLQETSLLPSFGMLHEAPQVSLEMPPLPPLPPMQWRVGKTQPAPPVPDSVLIKRSQESLLPSLEQDETNKFGYPGPHGGDLQPGNPFLPLAAAESDKSENMSETVVGNIMQTTVQPTVSPSELPSIADDSNCQHLNSSLELSELPDEEPEDDSSASEKEVVQSSSNLLLPDSSKENTALKGDTVSLQKTESHSPNQLASETGLEDEVPKEASGNLQQDHVNTCNMSVLPPRKVEEQPQHCLEDEVLKEASVNLERDHDNTCDMSVLPPRKVEEQPQHCLEDEVLKEASVNLGRDHDNTCDVSVLPPRKVEEQPQHCLEDEVLKEASLNLERDHDNTCDMSVLPPRKVEEQPQHGLLTSGGESAWPENPFVLLPTSESGKPNGSSVTKIPRPRNPLIDAVAAHDKSKLRKVTERVLPQSEPKVDERDSLLEQIRTKSFNLKRAVVTRPSMPGPTPNLKLAAILEKANAIRHATAGSDEDDSDSWSDS